MDNSAKQQEAHEYLRARAAEKGIPFQEFLDTLMRGEPRVTEEDLTRPEVWVKPMTSEDVRKAHEGLRELFPNGTSYTDEELRALRGPIEDDE